MSNRQILFGVIILTAICFLYYFTIYSPFKISSLIDFGSYMRNANITHNAIILARKPSVKVLKHFNDLLRAGVNAYVMCDEEPSMSINATDHVLYVRDEELARYGLFRNRAWDRAFVWLYNQSSIDYVWIMEDDLTWTNVRHMVKFFNKYARNSADLLSRSLIHKDANSLHWMWWPKTVISVFPENKWSGSLNMFSRVSRRLINAHQYYTLKLLDEKRKPNATKIDDNYYYQEFFIPTSANTFNLTIIVYDQSTMKMDFIALSEEDILKSLNKGARIFHPVKHDSQILMNASRNLEFL